MPIFEECNANLHRCAATQELLERGTPSDEIAEELRRLFGLDAVGSTAAVAAAALLMERGATIPADQYLRPYMARHSRAPQLGC